MIFDVFAVKLLWLSLFVLARYDEISGIENILCFTSSIFFNQDDYRKVIYTINRYKC